LSLALSFVFAAQSCGGTTLQVNENFHIDLQQHNIITLIRFCFRKRKIYDDYQAEILL